jgi:hypothetical protein
MDNAAPYQPNPQFVQKRSIEGAGGVLTLGILSLVFFMGLAGIILAIIALVKAKTCQNTYLMNPDVYTEASLKNVKAGKVCAIISLSLFGLALIIIIGIVALVGLS